jgi:nucleotide sugar dehydrogenase
VANIVVVGAGVVGTATGRGFRRHDHKVAFVDTDAAARHRAAELGFVAIEPEALDLMDVNAVFVAVDTPTGEKGIDLTNVRDASRTLGTALAQTTPDTFPVVVYRCTMPPGTTRELATVLEAASGGKAGVDFGVAYSPEYLRAETAYEDFVNPPLVTFGVVGGDELTGEIVCDLYRPFGRAVQFLGVEEAEFQKYVHNLFNAVKISFYNEMRGIASCLEVDDPDEVFRITAITAEGMWNPCYGIADLGPYRGSCLPQDAGAWLKEMERMGVRSAVVEAARAVNVRLGGR